MKKFFIILILFCLCVPVLADDDMFSSETIDFVEHAFDGIKPVTNEEFNKTINKMTPQPLDNSFMGKVKTFLFGRKYGVEAAPKGQDEKIDIGGEKQAIADMKNGIYYIKLVVPIIAMENKIIPIGHYKIKEQQEDNYSYIVFYQGSNEYGKLKLRSFQDKNNKTDNMTYARVDIVSDDIVRIVYATIKETRCAYAQVERI